MGSVQGGSSRARNILQHGLNWMTEDRFKDTLNERGKRMLERLIKMKEGAGEVGYSLANYIDPGDLRDFVIRTELVT